MLASADVTPEQLLSTEFEFLDFDQIGKNVDYLRIENNKANHRVAALGPYGHWSIAGGEVCGGGAWLPSGHKLNTNWDERRV